MNGVSYMIPFVVVGGLLIAVSLALGGDPQADGGMVRLWARNAAGALCLDAAATIA